MRTSVAHLESGYWVIDLDPAIAARFKRVFDGADKIGTRVKVSDTPRNAKDLLWFSTRHPIEFDPEFYLLSQATVEDEREESVLRILSENYRPSNPRLALPLRDYQARAVDLCLANKAILLGDDVGIGKQMPVDTMVLTPGGWQPIGEIQVGDSVIGSSGKPARVTGVFPQGVKPSYRMRFSDGSSVESGPDHLWTVGYWCGGRRWTEMVVTTEQIRTGATVGRLSLARTALQIPTLAGPVEFAKGEPLPLPPYTTGQLLANGALTHHHPTLTVNALDWPEIRAQLLSEGTTVGAVHQYGGAIRCGINGIARTVAALQMNVNSREKRIPLAYLRASAEDRVALLQGLMDGDGSCSASRNRVTFHSTSEGLAKDVRELVEQLGGTATIHRYDRIEEDKPTEFHVRLRMPLGIRPFTTTRKASRLDGDRRPPKRGIVGVEYVRNVESVCIRVDTEDALYVTEHCILTHNTPTAIGLFARAEALPAVVVTLTALPIQWEREVNKFAPELRTHIIKSSKPYPLDKSAKGTALPLPDVMIMSYSKLASRSGGKSWAEVLADEGMCRSLIFDEGQELRNNDSDKYRAAKYLRESANYCMLTTATPVYNHGGEIHNVVEIVQPGTLGTRIEFLREWCGRSGSTTETVEREGTGEMRKARVEDPVALGEHLRDCGVFLRRTRAEVGRELPGLQRVVHHANTDETLRSIDDEIIALCEKLLSSGSSPTEQRNAAGELDWKLRKATGLSKVADVAAFVRLLVEDGQKVLVYGWHRAWYQRMGELLGPESEADLAPAFYTGTESPQKKDHARARFMGGADLERARKYDHTLTETSVLLMSLRAGAGLDGLQHLCSNVVFGELDWSPGVHEQCLSADTEILTETGFRGPDDVQVGDSVAGFDLDTGSLRWVRAIAKTDRPLGKDEQMFSCRTEKIDVRVTGGHRMVVRRKRRTSLGVHRSGWEFDLAHHLVGSSRRFVPVSGLEDTPGVSLTDHELRLLGWFVTDGSFNGRVLYFYQEASQPWNTDLVDALNGCGMRWAKYQRRNKSGSLMNIYMVTRGTQPRWSVDEIQFMQDMREAGHSCAIVAAWLGRSANAIGRKSRKLASGQSLTPLAERAGRGWDALGPYLEKNLSSNLEKMTREQLRQFLHGVHMGDGSKSVKNVYRITSTNKMFVDRLQSLCVRRAFAANISTRKERTKAGKLVYDLWINDTTEASLPRSEKPSGFSVSESISGERVWCVTNELGTLVTRRNGKVSIVGNCEGRIYRDGQKLPVIAYYLVSDEGSDPVVLDALNLKSEQSEGIRNLNVDIAKLKGADPDQMKNLARAYLKKRGRRAAG